MLIDSVILVLREVLEAAILVSLLLIVSSHLQLGMRWLRLALPLAALGALWYANALDDITDAFDGAGQELANAGLQLMLYTLVLAIVGCSAGDRVAVDRPQTLRTLLTVALICALVREGSEIYIYIAGFSSARELRDAIYTGSAIGAGIGISLSILLYAALNALQPRHRLNLCLCLLCLIGGGMMMQATMLLQQIDWFPAGQALWDSSSIISEQSIAGELLYAVFGYESSPGLAQVALYAASLCLAFGTWAAAHHYRSLNPPLSEHLS